MTMFFLEVFPEGSSVPSIAICMSRVRLQSLGLCTSRTVLPMINCSPPPLQEKSYMKPCFTVLSI